MESTKVFIPASLAKNNQQIIISRPWYLRDTDPVTQQPEAPKKQAPAILQFRSDSFMEDFFAGIKKSANGKTVGAFEKLIGMRDYSEAPIAMMDTTGQKVYPASIQHDDNPANSIENTDPDPNNGFFGKTTLNEHPDRKNWLRKLYLTLHEHFHLVSFDLSCERQGYPRISKNRVIDSGVIVRRLIADSANERWEDWIPVNNEQGIWFDLASSDMKGVDPNNIFPSVGYLDCVQFFMQSGLSVDIDTPIKIQHSPLRFIPKSSMSNKQYSSLFGYLSLTSEYQQARIAPKNFEEILNDLKNITEKKLNNALLNNDQKPSEASVNISRIKIINELVLPVKPINTTLSTELSASTLTRKLLIDKIWTFFLTANTNSVWNKNKDEWLKEFSNIILSSPPFPLPNKAPVIIALWLHEQFEIVNTSTSNKFLSNEVYLFLVIILMRVRFFRLRLLNKLFDKIDINNKNDNTDSIEVLGDKINSILSLNKSMPSLFPNFSLQDFQSKIDLHNTIATLGKFYQQQPLQSISSGLVQILEDKSKVIKSKVHTSFEYKNFNLKPLEAPEIALLLHLGSLDSDANIKATISETLDLYEEEASSLSDEKKKLEARDLLNLVRPRYDTDSIYCVQCFVKIAGRNSCEKDQIIWSDRTEPFTIAEPTDILGVRPVAMRLPDIKKLIRDIPRISKARANPFASVSMPSDSGISVDPDNMSNVSRKMGIQMICSYGIPVFTLCAWVLFSIIFSILSIIPSFFWMKFLKFCLPAPSRK